MEFAVVPTVQTSIYRLCQIICERPVALRTLHLSVPVIACQRLQVPQPVSQNSRVVLVLSVVPHRWSRDGAGCSTRAGRAYFVCSTLLSSRS